MTAPRVSVLVPVRDEAEHIAAAVRAMRAQQPEGGAEFLILHSDSTDATLAELAAAVGDDPRFRVYDLPGTNVPVRLNHGLAQARGELIARMDAHALFPAAYLADGARRLARGDVASVSGPQVAHGEGAWGRRVELAMRSWLGRGAARFRHVGPGEVEVDSGYCGLWRRDLLVALGGWDERAVYGEDTELATRVRRGGGRIVCVPELAAQYLPRETLAGVARQYGRYAFRRAWIARRYPEALRRSQLLPPALVGVVALAVAGRGRPRRACRAAVGLYAAATVAEAARLGRGRPAGDAAGVPVVFATMHLAWGARGSWRRALRHGPPWAALARRLVGR